MSLMEVPRRLVDRLAGRPASAVQSDDPIARMVARTAGRLRPEGHYRWRLRGRLVNQFVATREGLLREAPRRAEMGRLGRAVLFASLGMAISVSAVGAASTSALPGDPLYGIKREVENLRMQIAPPSVRPMLAAAALEERLAEVEQLAAAGSWARVAQAEQEVAGAVATLAALGGTPSADEVAQIARHTQILTGLLAKAPLSARAGLERALVASASVSRAVSTGSNPGNHFGQENMVGGGGVGTGSGGAQTDDSGKQTGKDKPAAGAVDTPPAQSQPSPPAGQPTHPAKPATPSPSASASATASPQPSPSSGSDQQDTQSHPH
jgi:Domain of unknown function (DUF5667)